MIDFNERVPDNLDNETEQSLYKEISTIKENINKKMVEISTVKLLQYLKNNITDYKISLEVIEASGLEMDWDCHIMPPKEQARDYDFLKKHEDEIIRTLSIPLEVMTEWYHVNQTVTFVNNESGRDDLISYMMGDNWEMWKKSGQITEGSHLSKKLKK